MTWWMILIMEVLTVFVTIMCTAACIAAKREDGIMYVDPSEPKEGEGVYFQFRADPKQMKNGKTVWLRVITAWTAEK